MNLINNIDIELTKEEEDRVNNIILGIQQELNHVIESLKISNFDIALSHINSGIEKSNCPLCKRELGILKADIIHNKEICILNSDSCKEEELTIIEKAEILKKDFIPIKTKKKAIIEKRKELNKTKDKQEDKDKKTIFLPPFPRLW